MGTNGTHELGNNLAYCVLAGAGDPSMVVPRRHALSFMDMIPAERNLCVALADRAMQCLKERHGRVTDFDVRFDVRPTTIPLGSPRQASSDSGVKSFLFVVDWDGITHLSALLCVSDTHSTCYQSCCLLSIGVAPSAACCHRTVRLRDQQNSHFEECGS